MQDKNIDYSQSKGELEDQNDLFSIESQDDGEEQIKSLEEQANQQDEKIKLDYTIESPQERTELVKQIVESLPPQRLTHRYLQILADYIIFAMTKQERKSKKINTSNRMVTINKRETSFEGLVSKFENGEDGIYNLITEDKNIIFTPKISITEQDIATIPGLKELREAIEMVEQAEKKARGKKKFLLKKQLIQMRQDQYVIKNSYKQPMYCLNAVKSFNTMSFNDDIIVKSDGTIQDKSLISFLNPKHISALLCNYSKLKEDCYGKFYTDGYYLMEDLDALIEKTLKEKYPLYYSLMIYKIDGKQNIEIQKLLEQQHGIKHSVEYISSLWRNKIPKLLADQAKKDYLNWYFTIKEKGKWKKCSRCQEIKLAHNEFFSKNNSSKDGFYSICKCCRNQKNKQSKNSPRIIKKISYIRSENNNIQK